MINSLGTQNMSGRPLGRTHGIAVSFACAVALCLSIGADKASAADFCVGPVGMTGCPSGSTHYAPNQLEDAIDATIANGPISTDALYLYSGRYESTAGFNTGNSFIRIVGVGPTKPVLAISGPGPHDGQSVLTTTGPSTAFSNLQIEIPASDLNVGISASSGGTTIRNVDIVGVGSSNAVGVALGGSAPEIFATTISLPYAGGTSTAVKVASANSLQVHDLTVTKARTGIHLINSHNANIQRALVMAPNGIDLVDSPGALVSSSLLRHSSSADGATDGFSVRTAVTTGNAQAATQVLNSTLIGRGGSSSSGVVSQATNFGSAATTHVDSSVIFGHDLAVTTANAGAGADVSLAYSRFQGAASGNGGFAATPSSAAISTDPGFVNAAIGDFSLRRDSLLIDAGNPGAFDGGSSSDLAGSPRVVSRGSGNVRDIGAFEAQNDAPVPRISILSSDGTTAAPVIFSGSTSTDPDGDTLTHSWRFDYAAFANGVTVSRRFVDSGYHVVDLTVTDSTGRSATTAYWFRLDFAALPIRLRSRRVRTRKTGQFSILATCPDAAVKNCSGRMILRSTRRIKRKRIRAASYVFSIEPGTTRRLQLRTYRSFRRALRRYRRLGVSVQIIDGSNSNSLVAANQSSISLLAPRKSRRR
ncbi:MAG: PKD domain-containing protein [Solirubrobacterales bacterium]